MLTYINIDTILSDPLLLTATILLVVGPLLFLVSLWKLIRSPKKKDTLFDDISHHEEPVFQEEKPKDTNIIKNPVSSSPDPEAVPTDPPTSPLEAPVIPVPTPIKHIDMEKTVVMPPGMAEIQGQLEIAFSQIKHLNKKVLELEKSINSESMPGTSPKENAAEPSGNTQDFSQKLLKLAEHVIVLEKNMARLMNKQNAESTVSTTPKAQQESHEVPTPKPPIMPL